MSYPIRCFLLPALILFLGSPCLHKTIARAETPKLVVVVTVDQLCYEYLIRFRDNFPDDGFFRNMERDGVSFSNCHHRHAFTFTGPGHASIMTGAYPNTHGIVGNSWYDRQRGEVINCVFDPDVGIIGATGAEEGVSPKNLNCGTVGDVLKLATGRKAKVFSIAVKDRAAVLPAGHMADGVYWFDKKSGNWVTSTYYRSDLPGYIRNINEGRSIEQYGGREWKLLHSPERYVNDRPDDSLHERPYASLGRTFPHKLAAVGDPNFLSQLPSTPFANDLTLDAARSLIDAERLGLDEVPDLINVGLSANDYAGHSFGPYSLEVEDITYRTDLQLRDFARWIKQRMQSRPWLLVMTSDHGVAPIPEYAATLKLPAKRNPLGSLRGVQQKLEGKIRAAKGTTSQQVLHVESHQVYLGGDSEAHDIVAKWLARQPAVARVIVPRPTDGAINGEERITRALRNAYGHGRSGDVLYVLKPYQFHSSSAATHGSPWYYDTHVPMFFLGSDIQPGRYERPTSPAAIAPTIARLLEIDAPPASVEEPLVELLKPNTN